MSSSVARSERRKKALATVPVDKADPSNEGAESLAEGGRKSILLEVAARQFAKKGFDKTSMRDIAAAFGVLPGSLYHHFNSKDELFIAVYAAGVDRMIDAVAKATENIVDPWDRLEAACVAHLQELLGHENVLAAVLADNSISDGELRKAWAHERGRYEDLLRTLVDAVELNAGVESRYFRLGLLGAINWTLTWYQAGGESPEQIARKLVALFRPLGNPVQFPPL